MSRVLICSTYELGTQPLGAALPGAALGHAGHTVRLVDLSLDALPTEALAWADGLVCSVPMHTALRLALASVSELRGRGRDLPVAFVGLYAPVAARSGALRPGDAALGPDANDALLEWASSLRSAGEMDAPLLALERQRNLGPSLALLPLRRALPGLDRYARLVRGDTERLVAAVESSRGCNHRCRHCPVPILYDGRSSPVALEAVLADIDQVVALGATHITFADPDFLNRPQHARRVASALHARHPDLSFDATIKVSHLLRHAALFGELAELGLVFVVSAFESTSDLVLARLDKGHTADDLPRAVTALREHGIEIRPSLLPFTPWTTRADLASLFDFVAAYDLVANIDPIQYSIRLLLPPGSLLFGHGDPELEAAMGAYDDAALGFTWSAADAVLDELQHRIAARVELATTTGEDVEETYEALRALTFATLELGDEDRPAPRSRGPLGATRPRLTESWFCCAEPSAEQLAVVARAQ